jgi:hypothetical protein
VLRGTTVPLAPCCTVQYLTCNLHLTDCEGVGGETFQKTEKGELDNLKLKSRWTLDQANATSVESVVRIG